MTVVTADLSGGLDGAHESFLTERPTHPEMRDSATLWVMGSSGAIAFPRITIDAIGSHWEQPWVQLNGVLADGRAFRVWDRFPLHSSSSTLGAGPLRFECIDPFRRWVVSFDGEAEQSTTQAQMRGELGGTNVPLRFHIEAEMVAPPWLMGGMTPEAAKLMASAAEGAMLGGLRYEQLCRVSGQANVAGEDYPISGTGMRVRRQGIRNMGAATGHCQHSALFPSGRAFGLIALAPRSDGSPSFNEGFVITADGERKPVRVARAPWMKRLEPSGEDASLVLEAEQETIRIAGKTMMTVFDHHLFEMADVSVLEQGTALYVWDGEETIGLIERCTLRERLHTS